MRYPLFLSLGVGVLAACAVVAHGAGSAIVPENVSRVVQVLTLSGHTGYVRDVAFSPDAAYLASAGDDRTVRVWEVSTGEEIHLFRAPANAAYLNSLAFSPDGRFLSSSSGVFDLQSSALVASFGNDVTHTAFSPSGALLAVAAVLHPVQLVDTVTWDVVRTFESLRHIRPTADDSFGFEFSPDGALLADGTLLAGEARIWSTETGELARTLAVSATSGADVDIHDVAFSPDGTLLAAGGTCAVVRLFRVEDGEIERTLLSGEGVMSLDFSPDGRMLVTSLEGTVTLWDVDSGRRLRTLAAGSSALPVTFSPDGRFLACGVYGGRVLVWGVRE
jgi:WD40 repeat protein